MNAANLDLKSVIKIVKQPIEEGSCDYKASREYNEIE